MKRSAFRLLTLLLICSGFALAQQPVNDAQMAGTATAVGNGTTSAGSQRVTIASDNTAFSVNATLSAETTKVIGTVRVLGNTGAIVDAATSQNVASPANGLAILGQFNTSPTTISTGNMSPVQLDSTGHLLVNCTGCSAASTVSLVPTATPNSMVMLHHVATGTTNDKTVIKATAGNLYGISLYNNAGYPIYAKFYNTACASVTVGTTATVYEVAAQSGTQREVHTDNGIGFSNAGWCFAITKGIADADTTSLTASDATLDLLYE
jgi:hypothetical protein